MLQRLAESLSARPPSAFFRRDLGARHPDKRYLIATTGRSDSTFLCNRIADFGVLGYPMEFLNESYIAEFDRLFPNPNLRDYCHYVRGAFTSTALVFGLEADWWRFQLARELRLADELLGDIDLIVHVRCRDFVAQAVSLSLAAETGVWSDRDVGTDQLDDLHANAVYDAKTIKGHARNILNQEFHWRRFIAAAGAPCLVLVYEDIAANVDAAVRRIAEGLGVPIGGALRTSGRVPAKDSEIAQDWGLRFQKECEDFVTFWTDERGPICKENVADAR